MPLQHPVIAFVELGGGGGGNENSDKVVWHLNLHLRSTFMSKEGPVGVNGGGTQNTWRLEE